MHTAKARLGDSELDSKHRERGPKAAEGGGVCVRKRRKMISSAFRFISPVYAMRVDSSTLVFSLSSPDIHK